jgi:sigma54-dependent transcription regulator
MADRPHDLPAAWWAGNLEELDGEIARLATLCGVELLRPGVVQRVLQRDASVCGTDNPVAFTKLHDLLLMHAAIRAKSVDVFGPEQTALIERYVVDRLKKRYGDRLGP